MQQTFQERKTRLEQNHRELISLTNAPIENSNGIYRRYGNPVITAQHIPLTWRYDLNPATNPYLMERLGINATFNAGALYHNGLHKLVVRIEGNDRKSFFGIASSKSGIDNFVFDEYPCLIPETENPDTNIYDMRLIQHEDGWIYGLFCTERKDQNKPHDTTAAVAQCGIVRTKDLVKWERLPDLITYSGQQRNVVLHPYFINDKYALYTRPQDGFIDVGSGGGIGWGYSESMTNAEIKDEVLVDTKVYHTITEVKNGQGPTPLQTKEGWLHLAHGVRNTAAGLRYVLYVFMTSLDEPWRIIHKPGGYFIAPEGEERVGDVSNVVFSNGWTRDENDNVFIYYGSSDTRVHVATSSIDRLLDYVKNTPSDGLRSYVSAKHRFDLIDQNKKFTSS